MLSKTQEMPDKELLPKINVRNNPLILVHGFYSDSSALKKISNYLKKIGKSIYLIDLSPNDGSISIADYAKQLSQFISSNFGSSGIPVVSTRYGVVVKIMTTLR